MSFRQCGASHPVLHLGNGRIAHTPSTILHMKYSALAGIPGFSTGHGHLWRPPASGAGCIPEADRQQGTRPRGLCHPGHTHHVTAAGQLRGIHEHSVGPALQEAAGGNLLFLFPSSVWVLQSSSNHATVRCAHVSAISCVLGQGVSFDNHSTPLLL